MSQTNPNSKLDRSHIAPVKTREELIYLLSRAAELEHGLACIYLFAAYSLKSDVSEGGMTDEQATMVRGWRQFLSSVAVEEMGHLAQVSNLLTAIGGAPHFKRTNFPLPPSAYPFGIRLSLEPFSQETIERFVCYEMPETGILSAEQQALFDPILARVLAAQDALQISLEEEDGEDECYEPFEVDFKTVGEFYHKIETGFTHISEEELFIGPPEAQANARFVDLSGDLVTIVDRASACAAIERIVEQGEAPTSDHPDAHFWVFNKVRTQFAEAMAQAEQTGIPFEPVRPVVSNPMTHFYDDTSGGIVIHDPLTHEVADLFNVAYDTMLLILLRFFAHTEETEVELEHLSRATLRLMTTVIRPLAEALTKLPVDRAALPGRTAGPGFGYNRDIHLLPHKPSAWVFFGERLWQLAMAATKLRLNPNTPSEIQEAAAALQDLACQFATPDGPRGVEAKVAELKQMQAGLGRSIQASLNGPYLVTNADTLVTWLGERIPARPQMALCRCGGSAIKPFCDGTHARIGFTGKKEPDRVQDRRDTYIGQQVTVLDNRGICAHSGFCTDNLASVFLLGQEPFVDPNGARMEEIIAAVRNCPSGALSYALGGVECRDEVDQVREPTITVSKDGPYRITGGIPLVDEQGRDEQRAQGSSREHYSLCRCGQSKNKPFCSGMHWYVNFHDPMVDSNEEKQEAVVLPAADEPVGFAQHIKPLFRAMDRQSMEWTFDLWSYQDVKSHAAGILQRLQNGSMPCDGAWSHEKVETFQRWVESGMQE